MSNSHIQEQVLDPLFDQEFEIGRFYSFLKQLFPDLKIENQNIPLRSEYKDYIKSAHYCGSYQGNSRNPSDFLAIYVIKLKKTDSLNRSRTMQRNLIARYLEQIRKKAALTVFYDDSLEWRLSFVKRGQQLVRDQNNNITTRTILSSAKRHSFLVGSERNHTCKSRFLELMEKGIKPSLNDIEEIFNVETVTDEFFDEYKELYLKLKNNLDDLIKESKKTDKILYDDFTVNAIDTSDFAKKLMGQIVFIYFLQKKGWLGVREGQEWGEGSKDFFKKLYNKDYYDWELAEEGSNSFFNNCLERLFYKGFSFPDPNNHDYIDEFGFKIPFLNGGLFSPIIGYNWEDTVIEIDNEIFEEIIEVFDRFNFTVREDNPLEKEVAVDPEMLGKVFEKLLDSIERGTKGAFYTPREVVHYICKNSIITYLNSNCDVVKEDIEEFINNSDIYMERIIRFSEDIPHKNNCRIKIPDSIYANLDELDELLEKVKVAYPAVGSGAFPVGMMNEIVNARYILQLLNGNIYSSIYELKKETIRNSLYCVDIDYSATDIAKLRFWLSLIVDKEEIEPLPNLGNNVMCGNSLVDTYKDISLFNSSTLVFDKKDKSQTTLDKNTSYYKLKRINDLKNEYFNETIRNFKENEKEELNRLKWEFIEESYVSNGGDYNDIKDFKDKEIKPFFIWELEFSEIFKEDNPGFDIIIGNPPYVSTKGITTEDKEIYNKIYGIKDDLYNYFFLKSYKLLKDKGVLSFITSDTYLTINSKINLRELFEKNRIIELNKVDNIFKDPMVSPAIISIKKENMDGINYSLVFKDSNNSFTDPEVYSIDVDKYRQAPFKVIFKPTTINLQSYNKFNTDVNNLVDTWFEKIKTSIRIEKYSNELNIYRNSLKEGDITLLGLITEGGQGLATANNGKFVGVLEGTKNALKVLESRPVKLFKAITKNNIKEFDFIKSKNDALDFLNTKDEFEIRELFDSLKEKYGRDIFGQGYIFKIIRKYELADLNSLSDTEKKEGISSTKPHWVLYDKGDKDGNKWYLKTPFYIDWSKENVKFLKENAGKKGKGGTRFQNSRFYFREGFCWTDVNTTYIKSRLKENGIYDVLSMSLFSLSDLVPDWFVVCLLNSKYISEYIDEFINNTQHFQINDARIVPIKVPTGAQLLSFKEIFDNAVTIKKQEFNKEKNKNEVEIELNNLQNQLDNMVLELYMN